MLDQKIPARPRVALVFVDAGSAGHLRDAVSGHVDIVYETSAADFDVSRVVGARATAALVNLEDCESLDAVETGLQEAGVAVVFNDPEISSKLDGWAQARWLRHLTAKLSGNSDFDPPRPEFAPTAPPVAVPASETEHPAETVAVSPLVDDAPRLVERPLSPAEIESMTADFVAVREPQAAPAGCDGIAIATFPAVDAGNVESMLPAGAEIKNEIGARPQAAADAGDGVVAGSDSGSEHDDHDGLDVDTEALSAMIDARLAAAEGEPVPESPEVWRVVEDGSISAVELPPVVEPSGKAAASVAMAAPVGDDDVLNALPSVDDWQLVDPEAPVVTTPARKRDEQPALSIDVGGLELMPIETVAPVEMSSESIEQWMHGGGTTGAQGSASTKPAVSSRGEHA